MRCAGFLVALLTVPASVTAQVTPVSQTAESSAGQVGQRQTREKVAPNINPAGRTNSRIANRVESRIRNRIDRYYDPQANATSPFKVAEEQTRKAGKPTGH